MKLQITTAALGLALSAGATETGQQIRYNWSPQREILLNENLIDGKWGLIGAKKDSNSFHLDTINTYKGHNVYKFWGGPKCNRIELTECFVTEDQAKKYPKSSIEKLSKIVDLYGLTSCGDYGDTISYTWYSKFPSPLTKEHGGIFAQWHGRPDRTTIKFPDGSVKNLKVDEFLKLTEKITFKSFNDDKGGRRGIDNVTGKETGHILDGAAGGPIAAFTIGEGNISLRVRSGGDPVSTNSKPKIKPKIDNPVVRMGNRTGDLVYHDSIDSLPKDEWIKFRVEFKYSDYEDYKSNVLSEGHMKLWINDKLVKDWKGNVGKNDFLGPYFKFGIYKPKSAGFTVHHCGYERKIIKKGRRKNRTMAELVK